MAAPPSYTYTLDDETISTLETYVTTRRTDVISEHTLFLGAVSNMGVIPGLDSERPLIQGFPMVEKKPAREWRLSVRSEEGSNAQTFLGLDTLSTNIDDVGTAQRSHPAYYTTFAAIAWTDMMENSGPEQVLDLWKDQVDLQLTDVIELMETDITGSNTTVRSAANPDGMNGLQHMIATDVTTGGAGVGGSVWGLDRATYTFQRNQVAAPGDTFANVGLAQLRAMQHLCAGTNGVDKPGFHYTTSALHQAYSLIADGKFEINTPRQAELAMDIVTYTGKPVLYSGNAATNTWRMINPRTLKFLSVTGPDFQVENFDSPPDRKVAFQRRMTAGMNWGITRADRNGVITFTG